MVLMKKQFYLYIYNIISPKPIFIAEHSSNYQDNQMTNNWPDAKKYKLL